jgi:hypothetical protein
VAHEALRDLRRDAGASQSSTEQRTQAVEVRDATAFVDELDARGFEVELAREVRDLGREDAISCLRVRRRILLSSARSSACSGTMSSRLALQSRMMNTPSSRSTLAQAPEWPTADA